MPIIERYYLAVSLLLKAGSGRITQDALERQCQLMAQRMSLLYELNAPEFFERAQFGNFIDLARSRKVLTQGPDGKLVFEPAMIEAIVQRRAAGAARADPQQHPAGRAPLRPTKPRRDMRKRHYIRGPEARTP